MNSTDRDILVKNILVGPHDYTWTAYHLALAINKAIRERRLEKAAGEVRFIYLLRRDPDSDFTQAYVGLTFRINHEYVADQLEGLIFNDQQLLLGLSQRDHRRNENEIPEHSQYLLGMRPPEPRNPAKKRRYVESYQPVETLDSAAASNTPQVAPSTSAAAEMVTAASNTSPALRSAHDVMLSTLETIAGSFIPIFVELEELRQQKQLIDELAVKTPSIGLYLQGSITRSDYALNASAEAAHNASKTPKSSNNQ